MIVFSLFKGEMQAPGFPRQIIADVARRHDLTLDDLTGSSRTPHIALARQEAMWELRRRTRLSLPQIGARLGGRHHTTVLHGVRVHQARIDARREIAA